MGAPLGSGIGYLDPGRRTCPVCAAKDVEIQRLQAIIDKNATTADLMDRTLTALEKQLDRPLEANTAEKGE